jgi:hypothetical protein
MTRNKNLPPDEIGRLMRAACPVPGDAWWKYMSVEVDPGGYIKSHKHRQHLVMYYPDEAEPIIVTPQPGTMLYLPVGTYHEVPPVKRLRFSRAMLIEDKPCK